MKVALRYVGLFLIMQCVSADHWNGGREILLLSSPCKQCLAKLFAGYGQPNPKDLYSGVFKTQTPKCQWRLKQHTSHEYASLVLNVEGLRKWLCVPLLQSPLRTDPLQQQCGITLNMRRCWAKTHYLGWMLFTAVNSPKTHLLIVSGIFTEQALQLRKSIQYFN